jgi:hypothetical protein
MHRAAAMTRIILLIALLLPGVALAATTITVTKQPITITVSSSTEPRITVNARSAGTAILNVPGPQGVAGPIGPQGIQGIQGIQGEPASPISDGSNGKSYNLITVNGVLGLEEL